MTTPAQPCFNFTPLIAELPATVPFVGPEAQERASGQVFQARLGANENVFGPSPKALDAMERAARDVWKYPDPESHDLRRALAAHHAVAPENVVIGAGIDALLGSLARLFIQPGDSVVTSLGGYPTFNYHAVGYGGKLHKVPYKDDAEDGPALAALASETQAKLIYLANPDNPMGTVATAAEIQRVIDTVPNGSLLILDEAYIELAPGNSAPPIDVFDPRVIRMRTFSKAYGMAGARIGYAIGHADLIGAFNKIRNHFGVGRISQAGALAALADQTYLSKVVAKVARARETIAQISAQNGLTAIPSATNFVAVDCGRDGTYAKQIVEGLGAQGIFVRMGFVAPQDRCIRVSAGTPDNLALLAKVLPKVLENLNG